MQKKKEYGPSDVTILNGANIYTGIYGNLFFGAFLR